MTTIAIITICSLLLFAYVFDLTSSRTKIPSVILLLLLGWLTRQLADLLGIRIPYFELILPVFGTIGLILIVLEGALELELNHSKIGLIKKSLAGSCMAMLSTSLLLAFLFSYFGGYPFQDCLINAIPLAVISSSVAIPSAKNLPASQKEFVIYESSLSDICGVLFFNLVTLHETFSLYSVGHFGLQLIVILIVSFAATIGLSFLLSRIDHQIKYVPIILLTILIYAISKLYHLPGLLFILMFGLFLGNLDLLKNNQWISRFRPLQLDNEVRKFKDLTIEGTFIIRALFFLLFGYLIMAEELLNADTIIWSFSIVAVILLIRVLQLKLSGLPVRPLVFIAPRGLITILLFLSVEPSRYILPVNRSLIIQVIIITAFIMMAGLIAAGNSAKKQAANP